MSEWEIESGVTCVVCPGCAFTFDAFHEDDAVRGRFTCPSCGCQGRLSLSEARKLAAHHAAVTLDWERDWPEAIDPETGEDPDGVVHPAWVNKPEADDWTLDEQ